jgi:zinc protease
MTRWTEDVRHEVLPNGLTLLAQAIPDAPAVAVVSAVRAGFFDEPDRLAGVSHVLEHMLFKGTPTRGVGDIPRETHFAGGSLNAGTGYDHTSYYTVLPPESLRTGLELQSDALRRSTIDSDELRRELIVIKEEARRKLDTPVAVCGETLHELLFDRHRIRRWRIGTEEQLDRVTRDAVVEFYRSYYVPSETVVVMTGDLDPGQATALAREYYGDWPAEPPRRDPSPVEEVRAEARSRTLRGDLLRGQLAIGWRTVDRFHPDAIPLDVAGLVLSAGRSSWLYQGVRVTGAMTTVSASHFTPREVGLFSIAGELDPARLPDALRKVAGSVRRLREEGPSPTDLVRVRTLIEASWARRLESAEGRAHALASAAMDGDYRLLDEDFGELLAVTAEEVQRVAREWLDPAGIAGVAYLPTDQGEDLSADRLRETFQ